jgi:hypothetical protein
MCNGMRRKNFLTTDERGWTQMKNRFCHSRAGGNPCEVTSGTALWVPACAGMTTGANPCSSVAKKVLFFFDLKI